MSGNNDYTTEIRLLDYLYHQKYYKLIDIDSSRQTYTRVPQQMNVIGKLEQDDGATMFFIAEKNYSKLFFRFIKRNGTI